MKKSILFLLPAAALMLAGCTGGRADTSNTGGQSTSAVPSSGTSTSTPTSPTGSSTSEADPTNYGTLENPLTVTQALAIASAQCGNDGDHTKQRVYAQGIVVGGTEASYGWTKFDLAESFEDTAAKIYVYSANKDSDGKMGYPNDSVIVEGYIVNYKGTIEFSNTSGQKDYATFAKITRGVSAINYEATNATITGLGASAENGTKVSFTVTPDTNYVVDSVKVNNVALTAEEDVYKFVVKGESNIVVETHQEGSPVSTLVYALDGTDASQGSSGYAAVSEITQGGVAWDVLANTTINPWRFGGKSLDHEVRTATAKAAVSTEKIHKVEASLGDINITVDSVTLNVGTTEGTSDVDSIKVDTGIEANEVITFENASETTDWEGVYFTLAFEVSTTATSNKYVQLKSLSFYAMILPTD